MRKLTEQESQTLIATVVGDPTWQNQEYRRVEAARANDYDLVEEWRAVQLEREQEISFKLFGEDAID